MVPFLILFIINTMLIYEVVIVGKNKMTSKNVRNARRGRSMTISIVIVTLVFIILTGPFAFSGQLNQKFYKIS